MHAWQLGPTWATCPFHFSLDHLDSRHREPRHQMTRKKRNLRKIEGTNELPVNVPGNSKHPIRNPDFVIVFDLLVLTSLTSTKDILPLVI